MPGPPSAYVSYGGRYRIRWTLAGTPSDGEFFQPRLSDERTGAVLLDLWDADEGFTCSVRRADGPRIELAIHSLRGQRGQGTVALDLDAGTYRVSVDAGSLAAIRTRLDAAGLRYAGEVPPVLRDGGPATAADVTVDGRFRVAWSVQSEGHGAQWRTAAVTDARSGTVLVDLTPEYGFAVEVVGSADPVVELWVARVMGGGAQCNVVVDADARTFEVRNIRPPGATHDDVRAILRRSGLHPAAG